jgi:hypothetical protein
LGEAGKRIAWGTFFNGDQQAIDQQQTHLLAHQETRHAGAAQAVQNHHDHRIQTINLGPLGNFDQGCDQRGRDAELTEQGGDSRAVGQSPNPQPQGMVLLAEGQDRPGVMGYMALNPLGLKNK